MHRGPVRPVTRESQKSIPPIGGMLLFMEFSALCALQPQSRPLPQLPLQLQPQRSYLLCWSRRCLRSGLFALVSATISVTILVSPFSSVSIFSHDLSAGRLLAAAVIARINRCRNVSLVEKGCNQRLPR